jgi:hypothetical protein
MSKATGYKAEVKVGGDWVSNSLVFAAESEAMDYARALFRSWTLVQEHRVVQIDEAPNYRFIGPANHDLEKVEPPGKILGAGSTVAAGGD